MKKKKLTQEEMKERDEQIVTRYRTLVDQQPLATHYSILTYISQDYDLSPQQIGRIVNDQKQ